MWCFTSQYSLAHKIGKSNYKTVLPAPLFSVGEEDNFVMQHKEGREEERLFYKLAKQSPSAPSITVPILLPGPEEARERGRVTRSPILPGLPLAASLPALAQGWTLESQAHLPGGPQGVESKCQGNQKKMQFLSYTGRKTSKNTCKQRHFILGSKQ